MEEYAKKLRVQLEAELREIDPDGDAVKGYVKRAALLENYILLLQSHLAEDSFEDKAAEVHYFKYVAPPFYRDYYYYRKLYWLEVIKVTSDEEAYKLFLVEELERCNLFLQKRQRLHRYFYSLRTYWDEELFTWNKSATRASESSAGKGKFACVSSCRLGLIFSTVQYREFCKMELREIGTATNGNRTIPMKCHLSKTEAAEFVAIAFEMKLFSADDVPYTQVQIKEWVEQYWHIDLKDFKTIDKNNRTRKGAVPSLITKMLSAYDIRKDRLEKELRKKR